MTKLQDFLNSAVADRSNAGRRGRIKTGDLFGLEIECEGKNVAWDGTEDILAGWLPNHDGSLRDHHGPPQEWVFNGPADYNTSVKRVNSLFDWFEEKRAKIVCSNRTSVHVHFNMADKNVYQLINLYILFTILEGILDRYCGEDRCGNLFCLSSRHAEQQVSWVNDACFKHYSLTQIHNEWRYCSLNLASINKFGTVEFRGMRGLDNREDVLEWLSILNEFCTFACFKMKNPVDLVQAVSEEGPLELLRKVFSEPNVQALTKGLLIQDINQSIYEGLRLVQMLCYKIGTEFDQVRLRGRDFWTSFRSDQEPELDVDPKDFGQVPRWRPNHPQNDLADQLRIQRRNRDRLEENREEGRPEEGRPEGGRIENPFFVRPVMVGRRRDRNGVRREEDA